MTKDTAGKEIKPLTAENLVLIPCKLSSYSFKHACQILTVAKIRSAQVYRLTLSFKRLRTKPNFDLLKLFLVVSVSIYP